MKLGTPDALNGCYLMSINSGNTASCFQSLCNDNQLLVPALYLLCKHEKGIDLII